MAIHTPINTQRKLGRFLREVSLVIGLVDMSSNISFRNHNKKNRQIFSFVITINFGKLFQYGRNTITYASRREKFPTCENLIPIKQECVPCGTHSCFIGVSLTYGVVGKILPASKPFKVSCARRSFPGVRMPESTSAIPSGD